MRLAHLWVLHFLWLVPLTAVALIIATRKRKQAMKALITLTIALFFTTLAQAQNAPAQVKVDAIQMEVVLVKEIKASVAKQENQVARLYRRSGSRVKKELNFSTKYDNGIA